jgi:hypothetical protein
MAIFSRRTLQRMLNETAAGIPMRRRKEYARDLDKAEHCLALEWELALTWAFLSTGFALYEHPYKGNIKPDLTVSAESAGQPFFVADITTVSDKGIEAAVGLERFQRELDKAIASLNLTRRSFWIEFSRDDLHSSDEPIALRLPSQTRVMEFISTGIHPFLFKVQNSPNVQHEFDEAGITIR